MHENHKDDRHGEEVKMRHFGQLAERHRFPESRVRPPIVISDALRTKPRHAVRPEKRKSEADEHQK